MKSIFEYFQEICQIPHGSGNTDALSDYLADRASGLGLKARQDDMKNLMIEVPGTSGLEEVAPVILQGHLDMVCEKEPGHPHDFLTDPIDVSCDEEGWISADGTTLGADDGIALAYMLALMEDEDAVHPPLKLLMTVEEETSMAGASHVSKDWLNDAQYLINLDSEEEGVFTVGSAGGVLAEVSYPCEPEETSGILLNIDLRGLTGGHSGMEIDHFGANASRLLAQVLLDTIEECTPDQVCLVNIEGGERDNVIPNHAGAKLLLLGDPDRFEATLEDCFALYQDGFGYTDPGMRLKITREGETTVPAVEPGRTLELLFAVSQIPNGVQFMEHYQVRQSLNLGSLKLSGNALRLIFGLRANRPSLIETLQLHLMQFVSFTGGTIKYSDYYPSWPAKRHSELLDLIRALYVEEYGEEPQIMNMHAGLECGFFKELDPNLDIVSFGPDLQDVHTPMERAYLPSVEAVYHFLRKVLLSLAQKDAEVDESSEDEDAELEITDSNGKPVSVAEILKSRNTTYEEPDCSQCQADCEFRKE